MEIALGWILFAVLVGLVGSGRKIGFGMSLLWSVLLSPIIGLIIVLLSPNGKEIEAHRYKHYLELARKAKYKGNIEKAIDHYQDAMYHLENDYKTPNKERSALIIQLKGIVDRLKDKQDSAVQISL